jgi:hypothetical protein
MQLQKYLIKLIIPLKWLLKLQTKILNIKNVKILMILLFQIMSNKTLNFLIIKLQYKKNQAAQKHKKKMRYYFQELKFYNKNLIQ